jgi:hypothetical protein
MSISSSDSELTAQHRHLQIAQHVLAARSGEEAALALGTLDAEIEEFMSAHAVAVQ